MGVEHIINSKKNKNDEFYTVYEDIEKELVNYWSYLEGKIVYCNCDNPKYSQFYRYFKDNFDKLKLKKVIFTYYEVENPTESTYKTEVLGTNVEDMVTKLEQNGDFRSVECKKILEEVDVVVTNPPFSLFREFIALLEEYNKKYLVVGNTNATTYKDISDLFIQNKIWIGFSKASKYLSKEKILTFSTTSWFTNTIEVERPFIELTKEYNEKDYPRYDNYNAIEVSRVKNIPRDFNGLMGVPITFLRKYNPKQFELYLCTSSHTRRLDKNLLDFIGYIPLKKDKGGACLIDGKVVYARYLIKLKSL